MDIRITGRELNVPGSANNSHECTVNGRKVMIHLEEVDAIRMPDLVRTLADAIDMQRYGIRQAIKETLLVALHPAQTSSETAQEAE